MEFHAEEVPAAMTEEASEAHTEVNWFLVEQLVAGVASPQIRFHGKMVHLPSMNGLNLWYSLWAMKKPYSCLEYIG